MFKWVVPEYQLPTFDLMFQPKQTVYQHILETIKDRNIVNVFLVLKQKSSEWTTRSFAQLVGLRRILALYQMNYAMMQMKTSETKNSLLTAVLSVYS